MSQKPKLIVSLTSWPARIGTVHIAIKSLLDQTLKADKVILWLAPEQFPNKEKDLPKELLQLTSEGLTIDWYHNIRSHEKLIPTLKKYPNAIIVTADDANEYEPKWLEKLYKSYLLYPNDIHCHRVKKILCKAQFEIVMNIEEYWEPSFLNILLGIGGVLYPPHCLYQDILREDLISKLAPTNDDLWFWAQAVLNGVKIRSIPDPIIHEHPIKGTEKCALSLINNTGENLFWKDFHNILGYYPVLRKILRDEYDTLTKHTPDDDLYYLFKWYKRKTKQSLDLLHPKTYNEKIQWLKFYDARPVKTMFADKYAVRDFVAKTIGKKYLIPLLGVFDRFDDIDFNALPEQFVMQCNHGSGYNLIVKDKSTFNIEKARHTVNTWLDENFAYTCYEMHYKNIEPKIIIEKYIENKMFDDLYDYKFWCFQGKVKYIQVLSDRYKDGLKTTFFDTDWKKYNLVSAYPNINNIIKKPKQLKRMIEIAEKLSANFDHLRIDLYLLDDGQIYFGEITCTPASGIRSWCSKSINKALGEMVHIPSQTYNYQTGLFGGLVPKLFFTVALKHYLKIFKTKKFSLFKIERRFKKTIIHILGIRISFKSKTY